MIDLLELSIEKELTAEESLLNRISDALYDTTFNNHSLLSGSIGSLLYASYLYKYQHEERWGDKLIDILETIISEINDVSTPHLLTAPLAYGASGLGMVMNILKKNETIEIEYDEYLSFFDELVCDGIVKLLDNKSTDYLYGSSGAVNYLCQRTHNDAVKICLEHTVDKIESLVEMRQKGITFPNAHLKVMHADNYEIDLSLSHGQCGVLLSLLKIYEKGIAQDKIKALVEGGIDFLLSTMMPIDFEQHKYSYFPLKFDDSQPSDAMVNQGFYGNRLGWCYGDLNQVILLYRAGQLLNNHTWILLADEIGLSISQRLSQASTDMKDSHFCHGTSGLVQSFKSLYAITGLPIYQQTAQFWYAETLKHLEKELLYYNTNKAGELLEGFGATALVLIAELHADSSQEWDAIFLLS
ncbi:MULTISPECIES: lanthionine synthetase LanC family protein [unclassified Arcicella]|uniref:lanthionine synthetase LanC family protein n=1 Tax=unclassified Arcicella TaxID=2644986 RepID=UPI00285BB0D9|nr:MULTISPECIES: lanthionine synthetase LanC family protein [unclassified Arcicella]MDR6562170.1 lantibiotic modifying enzyme [Arcicella sp. BE51]MDR6812135.1 lantibiotic modifying enzyme [Arcicella sp. BE140]MDR6823447.1 lantibiotic modifying enzyme [Arcicella sp. BE139]